MIIFPAIDLKNGQAVRLQQGRMDEATVYSDDPVAVAQDFMAQGATHLHVVDLNGAVETQQETQETQETQGPQGTQGTQGPQGPQGTQGARPQGDSKMVNGAVLERLVQSVNLKIQVGGGIRTLERIEALLDLGVHRVILGTAAVRDPELVAQAIARFGSERVMVGIDAKDGRVAVQGWVETSDVLAEELGVRMRDKGVTHVIYTDIRRDGMLTGADIDGSARLAKQTDLRVIVSGGIACLDEVAAIRDLERRGVCLEGVVLGKALYAGAFSLREALQVSAADS
ncbi:MAG: 1-(5-phosphoribosyl)-5-[(5-phosphoribosylamino)methylideneamino] imidazole-4-carboxamide isomerase [Peptococcaceae bacterium]|nr:1-(5-phosphoribosyl)-5-[(5-phosphoribosylamino)methylideneamino] imidazole-4-carboxamide isomerase [Peptococcaceae bacterium]